MTYIEATTREIAPRLRRGQLVVLESTTYPGTTRELVRPLLDGRGLAAGREYFLAFSPEREDPGNPDFSTRSIPKVIGGLTESCSALAHALYRAITVGTVAVSSPDAAEATKLLENIFRSVNIALVNELKMVFDKMGIDVWEVIRAASTKPFGYMPFYPGPGLGGHCIPIDPFYLTWRAREFECTTRFIELAGEINTAMPDWVVRRLGEALDQRGKPLSRSRILLLGLAYKQDVDDLRESPALRLIDLLRRRGAEVAYHDPHIPELTPTRHYDFSMKSEPLTPERLAAADAVLIVTAHRDVDYAAVAAHASLVVDTRNVMRDVPQARATIVQA
jgi:UDP-N-acetyl-D-glucosamine dehydrogenase